MVYQLENIAEEWLVMEKRQLPLPDGSNRTVSAMLIVWASYHALISDYSFTPERIVELTLAEIDHQARDRDRDFDQFFRNVVAFLDQEFSKLQKKYPGIKQSQA